MPKSKVIKLTVKDIRDIKKRARLTVLTAYDFLTACILDTESIDIILVGDSLGMVALGYESTVPVLMRDMLHHTKAVTRGVKRALVVADMPFGSYDTPQRAVRNARRFLQEARADAVKVEGGTRIRSEVEALVKAGIPVMGHLGLTPQTAGELGGYKVQGSTRKKAEEIHKDAVLLDKLGVFAIVLECVPAKLAARVTASVKCPTIGIGAGNRTDGQVLVLPDMLGLQTRFRPKFVRRYASLDSNIRRAVRNYASDVAAGKFPSKEESY